AARDNGRLDEARQDRQVGGVVADAGTGVAFSTTGDLDVDLGSEDAVEVSGDQYQRAAATGHLGDDVAAVVDARLEPGSAPELGDERTPSGLGEGRRRNLGDAHQKVRQRADGTGRGDLLRAWAQVSSPSCRLAMPSRSA